MIEVTPIRAFNDNYLWLFNPVGEKRACIVDPGDAGPVLRHLDEHGMQLEAIFITHHHGDHTGGIGELLRRFDVPVYGPRSPRIPAVTLPLQEGDSVELFGQRFHVLEIPGHTLDHIAYYTREAASFAGPVLFCGDTLFAGGCGRVFEGSHAMMYGSLQKLAALPGETQVFCAHEYTLANLRFARAVTPDDTRLLQRFEREQARRASDIPTVPTTIGVELETNPFMRCEDAVLVEAARRHAGAPLRAPAEVFGAIREWKDSF